MSQVSLRNNILVYSSLSFLLQVTIIQLIRKLLKEQVKLTSKEFPSQIELPCCQGKRGIYLNHCYIHRQNSNKSLLEKIRGLQRILTAGGLSHLNDFFGYLFECSKNIL